MSYARIPYLPQTGFEALVASRPIYNTVPCWIPPAKNPNWLWTPEDDAVLRMQAAIGKCPPDIARQLGRSIEAVYTRASLLGISLLPPDPTMLNPYFWS